MQFNKLLLCRWTELSHITEEKSINIGRTIALYDLIPSLTGSPVPVAIMIFLGKSGSEYEVRVIKTKKNGNYIPQRGDYIARYEENSQYASFFFYCYYSAHKFLDKILPYHKEYNNDRPLQPLI